MHTSPQKVEETATRIFGNAKYKPNCSSNKQSSKNLFRRLLFPKHTHISSLLGLGFFTFLKILKYFSDFHRNISLLRRIEQSKRTQKFILIPLFNERKFCNIAITTQNKLNRRRTNPPHYVIRCCSNVRHK